MYLRRTSGTVVLFILVGAAIGTLIGKLISMGIPSGPVRDLITQEISFGIEHLTLNLVVVSLSFGFLIHFNLVTVIFIFLMIFILKKL